MSHSTRNLTGIAAATAALVIAGAGGGVATGATHQSRAVSATATPTIKVTVSKQGVKVKGATTFPAGVVDLIIKGKNKVAPFGVVGLKSGYTVKDYKKDYAAAQGQNKAALKALNHAVDNSTFYGGLDASKKQTLSGSVLLSKPGTYYLTEDGSSISHVTKLTVTGKTNNAKLKSDATVKAKSGYRFSGDTKLPAKGTITFKNISKGKTKSPHFLVLQHVAAGTTRKDIENYFASGSNQPPSFQAKGSVDTDTLSPKHSMTMTYSLPKGTYAELCFFPDLETGMPHAFMGMIKIVTLS